MSNCCTTTASTTVDLTKVKPYGDTMNDGKMELAFSLPVPYGEEAEEAAKQLLKQMGMTEPSVTYSKDMGGGFTFFVCYAACQQTVDFTNIHVTKVEGEAPLQCSYENCKTTPENYKYEGVCGLLQGDKLSMEPAQLARHERNKKRMENK